MLVRQTVLSAFAAGMLAGCETLAPIHDVAPPSDTSACPDDPEESCVTISLLHPHPLDDSSVLIRANTRGGDRLEVGAALENARVRKLTVSTGMRRYVVPVAAFADISGVFPGDVTATYVDDLQTGKVSQVRIHIKYGEGKDRAALGCDPMVSSDPAFPVLHIYFDAERRVFEREFEDACGDQQAHAAVAGS